MCLQAYPRLQPYGSLTAFVLMSVSRQGARFALRFRLELSGLDEPTGSLYKVIHVWMDGSCGM